MAELLRAHHERLARYNAWATEVLLRQVARLDEATYRQDVRLFFRSVHLTLNHILLAEQLWYHRFVGKSFSITGLNQELEADRSKLVAALRASNAQWIEAVASVAGSPERLAEEFAYVDTEGVARTMQRSAILDHVFNHATHHRGQISTALTQLGVEAPEMDLLYYILEEKQQGTTS